MTLQTGMQQVERFKTKLSRSINRDYLLYLPKDYNPEQSERWPFILFLHGAGERGNNVERLKLQGLAKKLEHEPDFPFVVVSPQCSVNASWSADILNKVLDEVVDTYNIDTDIIYVTGLSMGGFGPWYLAMAYPHRFAAIAPVCGGGDPDRVCVLKDLPIWTFHGAKDTVVPI